MSPTQQPVAIITGASSGIGLGLAQALLAREWCVVGTSRTISQSKEFQPSARLVLVDGEASKRETAVQVVDAAIKRFGRIDLLVNNAGIFIPKAFTDYSEDDYNRVVSTNVASMFFMTQQVIPQMKLQHSGHVVNISATLADQPAAGAPALLAVLSKSPMPAVSKALALEFAADNIRFNTVSPGAVNTPMHAGEDQAALADSIRSTGSRRSPTLWTRSSISRTPPLSPAKTFTSTEASMPAANPSGATGPGAHLRALGLELPATPKPLGHDVEVSRAATIRRSKA